MNFQKSVVDQPNLIDLNEKCINDNANNENLTQVNSDVCDQI